MVLTYFTIKDETFQRRGRLQKRSELFLNGWLKHAPVGSCALTDALSTHRESFALVKGAVHLLEDAEKAHLDEDVSSTQESEKAPDAQSRQLHAMVEQLRPEDTMKLVSVSLGLCARVYNKPCKERWEINWGYSLRNKWDCFTAY